MLGLTSKIAWIKNYIKLTLLDLMSRNKYLESEIYRQSYNK